MIRDDILARLQAHEPELRRLGVRSLALFGSVRSISTLCW